MIINIICALFILLGAFMGYKKGALKGIIEIVIFFAVLILSYTFKKSLTNFLLNNFPFFNFAGMYKDTQTINFYIYNLVSFLVIFIVTYCILNIILSLGNINRVIDRYDFMFKKPSKACGATLGAVLASLWIFILSFSFLMIAPTQKYVMENYIPRNIVQKMPIINSIFLRESAAAQKMYISNDKYLNTQEPDVLAANMAIARDLIQHETIDKIVLNKCIKDSKIPSLQNVVIWS